MKKKVRAFVAEKKIYVLLLLLCGNVMMFADGLTATLQHGTTMTAYFGQSALQYAYEAAADGDVITLSPGQFTSVSSIEKSVRIVGAYGVTNTAYSTFLNAAFTISADNVKLEGMYFQGTVTLGAIKNCTFKRCRIGGLKQSGTHTNTLIDQCVLMNDYAVETGVNYGIKNTTISNFVAMNTAANVVNVTNCFIWTFCNYRDSSRKQPYGVYKNCILGLDVNYNSNGSVSFSSPSEFHYNYFYKINSYSTSSGYSSYGMSYVFNSGCINNGNSESRSSGSALSNGSTNGTNYYKEEYPCTWGPVNGADNTPVGITGGEGFNEYPAIPRVLTASIDAQTDDKGKLNASITVKAEK